MKISAVRLAIAALLFIPTLEAEAPQQAKVRVGVPSALSGSAATYGLDLRDAVRFAAEKFGAGNIQLIEEDDRCSAKEGALIARKFVEVDKVDFVVGFACSSSAQAAIPILQQAGIPTIVSCASAPGLAALGDSVFRTTPSDSLAAKALFQHISRSPHRRIGFISAQTDYAQGLESAFKAEARKSATITVFSESYLAGASDLRAELLRLRKQGIEALVVNGQSEADTALATQQARESGWSLPLYGAYWGASPAFLAVAARAAEGMELVDLPELKEVLTPSGVGVFEEYLKKYPGTRSTQTVFATSYEALRLVADAVRFGEPLPRYLKGGEFSGIFGHYSFDAQGEIIGMPFVIKQVRNGRAVKIG